MKFVTVKAKDSVPFIGVLTPFEDYVLHLKKYFQDMDPSFQIPETMLELIELGESFYEQLTKKISFDRNEIQSYCYSLNEVTFLSPIPRVRKNIMCVGRNYAEHVKEMGGTELPEDIIIFTKAPTTVIGHGDEIPLHEDVTDQLDYEGELAIVIGKRGKGIKKEKALDHVFGYTILNDVTARDIQYRHKQFFLGKSLDGSCPIGPSITHKSMIPTPNCLTITTKVNGEIRQHSNTKHFIFSVERIIEEISKGMTLEPGDIIATGTPAGVGKGFQPPKFLKAGDQVEIEIEKLGVLRNTVQK
jgi:2-keto-4-pentenoate hydratase/2-oxohepta-3-ene-1,7-dioic acid hydratase in catechol pathway